ncbi:Uncharacterised protein [Vibrio cholerae]|nr:Uncharacterised protein [Vibrio cholerae]
MHLRPVKLFDILHTHGFTVEAIGFSLTALTGQQEKFIHRKLTLLQYFQHGFAYSAGCAKNGNIKLLAHHIPLLENRV